MIPPVDSINELDPKVFGQFNIFKFDPTIEIPEKHPYRSRDFYKITIVRGGCTIHYADRSVVVEKQAIAFSNPQIPYNWEQREKIEAGYFCVFTPEFFNQFGNIQKYDVFQINASHVFEINDETWENAVTIYEKMVAENDSDYVYKNDVLRTSILDLIHLAMKLEHRSPKEVPTINASHRITELFMELLDRQFLIDDLGYKVELRTPSDYARQLSIHTNHLNKAIKEVTTKTTSQVIAERIEQEAKSLLKHTHWNVSEIAYSLGFDENSHFNHFFKKVVGKTPLQYRNI